MFGGVVPRKVPPANPSAISTYIKRMKREEGIMANQINVNEAAGRSGRRAHSAATTQDRSQRWWSPDAARFLFKGQCYDAGPESDTTCSLCGWFIRLVYILKVVESHSHSCAQKVGKLSVGECCFKPIEAVNEELYRQLLAAAVNLRTYIEAIERDQRIFGDQQKAVASEKVKLPRLGAPGPEKGSVRKSFEALVNDGGDHA